MNDRYLYRAKRTDNGEFVEGLLTIMWGQFHIINPDDENTAYPINESTICQCTGLKDKNGNLIWENDIVKDNVIFGSVSWDDINARFVIDDIQDGYQDYSDWWHEVQVIGNIFDNQELLQNYEVN